MLVSKVLLDAVFVSNSAGKTENDLLRDGLSHASLTVEINSYV